jgi:hypothetical protein
MMGMDEVRKIPPEKADALARRLHGSLERRRPRTWLIALVTIGAVLLVTGLLVWWLYDPTEPLRLEVVAVDAVVAPDETAIVRAQLAFPDDGEHAPALLNRRDVVFVDAKALPVPGHQPLQKRTESDAQGRAAVEWARPGQGDVAAISIHFVDAKHKQGSADQASLFLWERQGKILLVDVEETLAQIEPGQWEATPPDKILPRPQAARALQDAAAKKYRVGYLALAPGKPLTYRMVRGWVRAPHADKERFPVGPVFGRPEYATDADVARAALLRDLQARFGDQITLVVNRAATAAQGRAAGIRVITIGAEAPAAGAANLASWSDLADHLNP